MSARCKLLLCIVCFAIPTAIACGQAAFSGGSFFCVCFIRQLFKVDFLRPYPLSFKEFLTYQGSSKAEDQPPFTGHSEFPFTQVRAIQRRIVIA